MHNPVSHPWYCYYESPRLHTLFVHVLKVGDTAFDKEAGPDYDIAFRARTRLGSAGSFHPWVSACLTFVANQRSAGGKSTDRSYWFIALYRGPTYSNADNFDHAKTWRDHTITLRDTASIIGLHINLSIERANMPSLYKRNNDDRGTVRDQIEEFLLDREARMLSADTITWYTQQLGHLCDYLTVEGVQSIREITPLTLKMFLVEFGKTHNPGGTDGVYRAMKAFFNWYAEETDEDWKNPIKKVDAPKVPEELLDPVELDDVRAMLGTCKRRTFNGDRDEAILRVLLDSGCRRAKFCALNVGDVNLRKGFALVRRGKGGKSRIVGIGKKALRALRAYLRHRDNPSDDDPLWVNSSGERLSHTALRAMLIRRAKLAGVPSPSIHAFRRAFAINAKRNGCDALDLQEMLGHSSLEMTKRYVKQDSDDLLAVHRRTNPGDHLL